MSRKVDYSAAFYQRHAQRYAEVTAAFIQSRYSDSTHPALRSDHDKMDRLEELIAPGSKGLDAGCGPGASDVHYYWSKGHDIVGVDALEESIKTTINLHPR